MTPVSLGVHLVSASPGSTSGVDDPLAEKQFGDPVAGSHQVAAAVLAGPDQVTGGFLAGGGDRDGGDLSQMQQSGQMGGIAGYRS